MAYDPAAPARETGAIRATAWSMRITRLWLKRSGLRAVGEILRRRLAASDRKNGRPFRTSPMALASIGERRGNGDDRCHAVVIRARCDRGVRGSPGDRGLLGAVVRPVPRPRAAAREARAPVRRARPGGLGGFRHPTPRRRPRPPHSDPHPPPPSPPLPPPPQPLLA